MAFEDSCWLCLGLGGIAIHYKLTEQLGRQVLVPHRPVSESHPVAPCPVCAP